MPNIESISNKGHNSASAFEKKNIQEFMTA